MNRVQELIGASYAYERGFTGNGIGVAVLDSGLDTQHPDLRGRMAYAYDFINNKFDSKDVYGHGTHISGIIGGSGRASGGRYQGLAPGCHFVSLKVLDERGNGESIHVIRALHWLLEHGNTYKIRIINISVGSTKKEGKQESSLIKAVEEVWDAGFIICAAAGNQGPGRGSVTVPGTSPRIITVGASDDGGKRPFYSGRGPTRACVCKPDLVAPGTGLISCSPLWRQGGRFYSEKSGTSMATAVVTGSICLLLSKAPDLTNKEVKLRLRSSCLDVNLPKSQQGWGRIDLPRLLS